MSKNYTDATWLFDLAVDWHLDNPSEQIPDAQWSAACVKLGTEDISISSGEYILTDVSTDIIPVLAGISIGMSPTDLQAIARHHHLFPSSLSDLNFKASNGATSSRVPLVPLSEWNVCREVIQAISLNEDHAAEFKSGLIIPARHHNLEMACILSDCPEFWPVTSMERDYAGKNIPKSGRQPPSAANLYMSDINLMRMPKEEILKILERAGVLSDFVTEENGFDNSFWPDLFTRYEKDRDDQDRSLWKNTQCIVGALRSITCTDKISKMAGPMLSSLSQSGGSSVNEGLRMLRGLHYGLYENGEFKKLLDKPSMRMGATSVTYTNISRSISPDAITEDVFQDFILEKDLFLAKLSSELDLLEPSEVLIQHFRALGSLGQAGAGYPTQKTDGLNIGELIHKVFSGLDAYIGLSSPDISIDDLYINDLMKEAIDEADSFASTINKDSNIDYKMLSGLSSTSKSILAKNGFDIKKLPGMTMKDKGNVLSSQLGI